MREVTIKARTKENFSQEINAGAYKFISDAPKAVGGVEAGPDPHDLLLGALGACTSITMQMYAKRKGWDLKNVSIKVSEHEIEDSNNSSQKIIKIIRHIRVEGNLAPEQVEQLKVIADKCPIHKLLSGPKQIETEIAKATPVA